MGGVPSIFQPNPVPQSRETPAADTGLPTLPAMAGQTPTLYDLAPQITGPVAEGVVSVGAKIPGIGGKIKPEIQSGRTYFNSTTQSLIPLLTSNPRFPVAEQKAIKEMLDIKPGFFDSGDALRNRIVGVDKFLSDQLRKEQTIANDPNTSVDMRKDALKFTADIQAFRQKFVPQNIIERHDAPHVFSVDEVARLPDNSLFYWNGKILRRKTMPSTPGAQ